jgi:hypothetical protein
MNKQEHARRAHLTRVLVSLGFTEYEAEKLRRISLTLRRWHELECGTDGGCIERNDDTGRPYWLSERGTRWAVPDREKGARKRLGHIVGMRNTREWARTNAITVREVAVVPYIQTDPRGAALYLMRPNDLADGANIESCYTRGICVY